MNLNEIAANWWGERFKIDDKREAFKAALLKQLPDADWELHCDYDPKGLLLEAVQEAGVKCRGYMFSADGILPYKTWLIRERGVLRGRDGLRGEWVEVGRE